MDAFDTCLHQPKGHHPPKMSREEMYRIKQYNCDK